MSMDVRQLRELTRAARGASDTQLVKIIMLLDRLPARGEADILLDAARARLRGRMPERPLKLQRLLFLPLGTLLVSPRDWRREAECVPRSAIPPLTAMIQAAHPGLVSEVEAGLARLGSGAMAHAARLAEQLWPAAAAAVAGAQTPPEGWMDAGLPAGSFFPLAATCAAIWRHAPALWRLRLAAADGPPEEMARPLFRAMAAEGAEVVGLGLSAVLPFAARPAQLISIVSGLNRALAPIAEAALDRFLAGVMPPQGLGDLAATAAAVGRFVALMNDLDRSVSRDRPRRGLTLQALRGAAANACAQRVAEDAEALLVKPLAALLSATEVPDAAVEALEARAISLRSLAEAGRRLQAGAREDPVFRDVLARLSHMAMRLPTEGEGFLRADALRLVQILAGPQAACRLTGSK